MPSYKRKFGDLGEKLACKFLLKNGYSILQVNYQKRIGEIDEIAEIEKTIHFIEVKTRTVSGSKKYGLPQEAVGYYKQRKLIKTALFYLAENNYSDNTNWQIDVIAILVDENKKTAKIQHIKNAVSYDSL